MKKIITMATFALLATVGTQAQSVYDAAKFANKDLTGSARFVGMGGAMGALGGDISTMGVNPAGIGIYRSNDVMGTISYSMNETKSTYRSLSTSADKNKVLFDNVGLVFATPIGSQTSLRYVNFGFNYQRTKSFYKNMRMEGLTDAIGISQVNQMANQANNGLDSQGNGPDLGAAGAFDNPYVGWLSALGWQGYLLNEDADGYYTDMLDSPYMLFESGERGGIDKFDFNISFNFNERVYFGITLGAYDVNYRKSTYHDEDYGNGEFYYLQGENIIDGSGFDVKLGMIVRPFEYSPLRLGLAIHTPTFYKLTQSTAAYLYSEIYNSEDKLVAREIDTVRDLDGYYMPRDFKLQTPWLFNVSLGYTIGRNLAIGAEYEYEDYSTMKYKYPNGGGTMAETEEIKAHVKAVNTFRIGAEYKIVPEFALRVGYNYSSTAFKDGAWKNLPYNAINVDTDYANTKGISNYTFGFGYRGSSVYADLAYKYNNYKEDFYAFDNVDLDATNVKNNNHQLLFTLGMRF
ncbi:TonB-dependent receptor [Bacteroides sp. OttesenSCG-928-F21]|nr:TonB-dependent receptor [Bacteroides sp. OttesenSCG-928-F21]